MENNDRSRLWILGLHFCEFDGGVTENRPREFTIYINNHTAETKANVIGGAAALRFQYTGTIW